MGQCKECGKPTRGQRHNKQMLCGLCHFEAARSVPIEVVEQLKREEIEAERRREAARYSTRTIRQMPVVIVQYISAPTIVVQEVSNENA